MTAEPPCDAGPARITYVISAINTENAGTEGHLLRLIRRLDRSRFQPQLVVMQRSPWTEQYQSASDVPLHVLDFKSFMRPADWLVISKLARIFRESKTEIADLHFVDAHFAGTMAAHLAKVPVIVANRRDLGYQYGIKEKVMVRLANRYVTRFVANAKVVADKMSVLEGVPANRFAVIYNGIDLEQIEAEASVPVTEQFERFTTGKRVVSIAANLRPVKRLDVFLGAASIVAKQLDDVVFVIMGGGQLREQLEAQTQRLGIKDRVLFLGSVPSTAPYLKRSHVGCLSSESEGFSNSVVECMAARLPVVVTRVGGLPEAIIEGKSGLVADRNNADSFAEQLVTLLNLPEAERIAMGEAARQRVERLFSMSRHIQSHSELYERELAPRSPRPVLANQG